MTQMPRKACLHTSSERQLQTDPEAQSKYWGVTGEHVMLTYFEVPPNATFAEHSHASEQITHVLEGKLFFRVAEETYCVDQGDCIVIPCHLPHSVWTEADPARAVDAWAPVHDKYQ